MTWRKNVLVYMAVKQLGEHARKKGTKSSRKLIPKFTDALFFASRKVEKGFQNTVGCFVRFVINEAEFL
jgi:hypothetical protein